MAQATMTVRTDAAVKEQFTSLCERFGMSVNTAMNIFMRAVMENQCIPFQIGLGKTITDYDIPNTDKDVVLQALCDQLSALQSLSEDWDVYGTPVPSAKCVNEAKCLVYMLPGAVLENVVIEPSEWGGVSLQIKTNNQKVSVRILDSGITWYVKGGNGTQFHEEEPCSDKIYSEIVKSVSSVA